MAVDRNKLDDLLKQLPDKLQNEVFQFANHSFTGATTGQAEMERRRCDRSAVFGIAAIRAPPIMSVSTLDRKSVV